jgi:hypothetical protein
LGEEQSRNVPINLTKSSYRRVPNLPLFNIKVDEEKIQRLRDPEGILDEEERQELILEILREQLDMAK